MRVRVRDFLGPWSGQSRVVDFTNQGAYHRLMSRDWRRDGPSPDPRTILWTRNIRQLREKLGLSQREFAAIIKANPCSVWQWEAGLYKPSVKYLFRIAALHPDFGLEELFPETDPRFILDKSNPNL